MALELLNNAIEAFSKKVKNPNKPTTSNIPSLSLEPEEEKKTDIVYKYYDGEIVNKDFSDQQGQRGQVHIPKWMQKGAAIPDHVKDLKCEKITFPKTYYSVDKWVVLIRNVLTKDECNELIKFSETQGYEDALVNIGWGRQQKMLDFRNCKRMMIDNYDMVDCLWSRTQQFIPTYFGQRKKISFNERLRFLRYYKGEFFGPHFDGTYCRENGEISKLTFLVYLNDGFKGGSTRFLQPFLEKNYHGPKITTGMVVMFQHDVYHEGAILEEGVKYIIRTDVMYTKKTYKQSKINVAEDNVAVEYVEYNGWNDDKQKNEDEKNDK